MPVSDPQQSSLAGSVAVVTGATSGIGKEIARGLVQRGAHVVLGTRTEASGKAAAADISRGASGHVTVLAVDVSSQASVRAFAAEFTRQFAELHVLVNNAGAWFTDRRESADGIELTFATNAIGPHLLTEQLLESLRAGGRARVVNVVSSILSGYDASDLQFTTRSYSGFQAYGQSKRALCMLTWGLARRLAGSGITANAVAPGFVKTGFNRHAKGFQAAMIGMSSKLFGISPAKGATTPLWVATAPELADATGQYFESMKAKPPQYDDADAIAALERHVLELEQRG